MHLHKKTIHKRNARRGLEGHLQNALRKEDKLHRQICLCDQTRLCSFARVMVDCLLLKSSNNRGLLRMKAYIWAANQDHMQQRSQRFTDACSHTLLVVVTGDLCCQHLEIYLASWMAMQIYWSHGLETGQFFQVSESFLGP